MKQDAPIGVFDSGVGGLTVVKEIMSALPGESIIYYGDTARVPYGSKSAETITAYSRQIARFLMSQEVKAIVVACNTASALALETIKADFDVPFVGVVKPGAKMAAQATRNKRIGIIATEGTIGVHSLFIYPGKILRYNLIETKSLCIIYVVIYHIHHHMDTGSMQCLHHLLHLSDTDFAVVWIGGIRSFRYIVVHRIIAPVKLWLFQPALVYRTIIIYRQQMQMGDSQLLQIVQTGHSSSRCPGSFLYQSQELTPMCF